MERMNPLDATFLHIEDGINHMHIGAYALFEGPAPRYAQLRELFRRKLPLIPRYRQKVRFVPGALGRPVWVDDPHFNLDYHIRHTALAPPGDDEALRQLMGRLMSQELDRHRPLWESWFVEGLPDGRWALICKVHHCMVDGIAGTDLMAVILDHDRTPEPAVADDWRPAPEPTGLDLLRHSLVDALSAPVGMARWAGDAVRRPQQVRDALGALAHGARSLGERLRPNEEFSIEGTIGPHRRWAWARTTLDDIKVIRTGLGGTVNDVVLASITQGYRALLQSRDEDVDGKVLHTLVPVSIRAKDDKTRNNQVAAIIAELPIGIDDPVACLESIEAQMGELKGSHQVEASNALFTLADMAPPLLFAAALRGTATAFRRLPQRSVNTVTTNVPGPPMPLYACGREMLEYFPYVPLAQGLRTGIAILSYNRKIAFGVTGDWDTMADLDVLAKGIDAGLHALTDASRRAMVKPAPAPRAATRAKPTRAKRARAAKTATPEPAPTRTGTRARRSA